jgi:hypothetical protein
LRSDLFWDIWLIPLLQSINKGAEIIPDEPYVNYNSSDIKWPWSIGMRYHVGVDGGHSRTTDPYYAFTKDNSQSGTWNWCGTERVISNSASDGREASQIAMAEIGPDHPSRQTVTQKWE